VPETTVAPAIGALVLERLLQDHPELLGEVRLHAAAAERSIDADAVAEQVARTMLRVPFTAIAGRLGRDLGHDETAVGWALLEEAIRPYARTVRRLATEGHVLAAQQVALGAIRGLGSTCADGGDEVLLVWMGGYDMAYDLAVELAFELERGGVAVPDGALEQALGGPFGTPPEVQHPIDAVVEQVTSRTAR
jgi:hypothetical protein